MQAFKLLDSHQKHMTEKLTNVKQEMADIELWTQTEQDPESFSSVLVRPITIAATTIIRCKIVSYYMLVGYIENGYG